MKQKDNDKSDNWDENIVEIVFKWLSFLFLPLFFGAVRIYIAQNTLYSSYAIIFTLLLIVTALLFFIIAIVDIFVMLKGDLERFTEISKG